MWKDVTPFPDQDAIRHDIVQAKFRSKLDMTEAYEQTRIRPEDVGKTTLSTIFSIFQSRVMQMGDCNAPSISAVNDCYIVRFPQKVCACISRQYIHILSEHLRAHRAHNESASTTQRVIVLLVKIQA